MTTKYIIAEQVQMLLKGGNPSAASSVELSDIMRNIGQVVNSMYKTEQLSINMPSGETMPEGAMLATYEDIDVVSWKGVSKSTLPVMPISLPRNIGVYHIGLDATSPGSGFAYLAISDTPVSIAEGNSGATDFQFAVVRSGNTTLAVNLSYNVIGSGSNPANASDFVGGVFPSGVVSFSSGQTTQYITIQVQGDMMIEADEQFSVIIHSPSSGGNITDSVGTGIIENDDLTAIAISNVYTYNPYELDSSYHAFNFEIVRTGDLAGTQSVDWAVTGSGTYPANAADFEGGVFPSGTVTFLPGEDVKSILVNVKGDTTIEEDETFTVTISNATSGAQITTASVQATILNDDAVIFDNTFDQSFN